MSFQIRLVVFALICFPALASADFSPSKDFAQVLARLDHIQELFSENDGIARFNYVYRQTTRNMKAAIEGGRFANADFMERFTIQFADHYFRAFDAYAGGRDNEVPRAWRPLFLLHTQVTGYDPVQFVIAGMDAHIGRDLPVVLSELFNDDDAYPRKESDTYLDYKMVNTILKETFDDVHDHILTNCDDVLGSLFCSASDEAAIPTIAVLRRKAWFDGHVLWKERNTSISRSAYLTALDSGTSGVIRVVLAFKKRLSVQGNQFFSTPNEIF